LDDFLFPVKVPYAISADITKFTGNPFDGSLKPSIKAAKEAELQLFPTECCALSGEADTALQVVADYRQMGLIEQVDSRSILLRMALSLNEDMAVLRNGHVEAICFCFPSGFIPARIVGLDFFSVHLPVADGERLRAAGSKVSARISAEGALFRRYVWGLSPLATLSQHPAYHRPVPAGIEDLYFRTETQTTIGLKGDVCLFLVNVQMRPLSEIWEDPEKRTRLMESVRSMSDAVLHYKQMVLIRDILSSNA
jgi:hypothetical protein